jgi:uncharacterized LabA/DUF88 family protein
LWHFLFIYVAKLKTVVVFVDGQNVWHSLKKLDSELCEEVIDWTTLFNSVLEANESLKQVLWFRPAVVEEIRLSRQGIADWWIRSRYKYRKEELLPLIDDLPVEIFEEVNKEFQDRLSWLKKFKAQFTKVNAKYFQFELEYPFITICKVGALKVNPYPPYHLHRILGEKGVDVAIATKIVEYILIGECDKAILVSGDSDYHEAIKIVQQHGKEINCVKFGDSMSQKIEEMMSKTYEFNRDDLLLKFKKGVS